MNTDQITASLARKYGDNVDNLPDVVNYLRRNPTQCVEFALVIKEFWGNDTTTSAIQIGMVMEALITS